MTELEILTATGRCAVRVGASAGELEERLAGRDLAVVADANVRRLYPEFFAGRRTITLEPGETAKTLRSLESVYEKFLDFGLDRSSFILGVGGGITCDVAGFAASTYLRGIGFGFVATTLLAQVDAAIGGKNGLNFKGLKNMIGVIRQPEFVLADPRFLKTLPPEEMRSGLAESFKSGLIADSGLFEFLEQHSEEVLGCDEAAVRRVVEASASVKVSIVQADEREGGERRKLNFGHTLGHAIEKVHGLRHGEAVSIGMVMAAKISAARGMLASGDVFRIKESLERAGLPTHVASSPGDLIEAVRKDKKRSREDVHFVCLRRIGRAEIVTISCRELEERIHDLHKHS